MKAWTEVTQRCHLWTHCCRWGKTPMTGQLQHVQDEQEPLRFSKMWKKKINTFVHSKRKSNSCDDIMWHVELFKRLKVMVKTRCDLFRGEVIPKQFPFEGRGHVTKLGKLEGGHTISNDTPLNPTSRLPDFQFKPWRQKRHLQDVNS